MAKKTSVVNSKSVKKTKATKTKTLKEKKKLKRKVAEIPKEESDDPPEVKIEEEIAATKLKKKKKKPTKASPAPPDSKEEESKSELDHSDFHSFGLDPRLVAGIAAQGWAKPTLVQDRFIPLALEGKDILARARTGSGKTAAFAIPLIQRVLEAKEAAGTAAIRALVLTPSKELARQVSTHMDALLVSLRRAVRVLDLSAYADNATQAALLAEAPDVVVGTPGRVLAQMESGGLGGLRRSLLLLVVDEADLIFSLGFQKEAAAIVKFLPSTYQAFLTSATLSPEVGELKTLLLHNAVTLKLEEAALPPASQLSQYRVLCSEEEKWVVLVALLKLTLLRGKSLIFVRDTERCYRLKLFLQQFGIRAAVLNSFLPANARCHIVEQFNEGAFPLVIAADDSALAEPKVEPVAEGETAPPEKAPKPQKKGGKRKADRESGVARGIDFQQIANVVNFDFPTTPESYIHRVGRTARGWNSGTALSFAAEEDEAHLAAVVEVLAEQGGTDVLKPYQLRMDELDGFRYRARDVLRSVTASAVREARLEEIKREILNSKRLKGFFAENPRDLNLLQHDASTHGLRHQEHLRHVPDYIVPETLRGNVSIAGQPRKRRRYVDKTWLKAPGKTRSAKDPLKSLDIDD